MRDGPRGPRQEQLLRLPPAPQQPAARRRTSAPSATPTRPRWSPRPRPPRHRACVSCHEKHRVQHQATSPTACGAATARRGPARRQGPRGRRRSSRAGPHKGDCKRCHTLHGSPGVPKAACFKCHDKVEAGFKPPNETHATCKSCHTAAPPGERPRRRAAPSCHEREGHGRRRVARRPRRTPRPATAATRRTTCAPRRPAPSATRTRPRAPPAASTSARSATRRTQPPPGTGPGVVGAVQRLPRRQGREREGPRARSTRSARTATSRTSSRSPQCASCHKDMASKGLHPCRSTPAKCSACHDPHVKSEPTPSAVPAPATPTGASTSRTRRSARPVTCSGIESRDRARAVPNTCTRTTWGRSCLLRRCAGMVGRRFKVIRGSNEAGQRRSGL